MDGWTRFELTITRPDGHKSEHHGWCREVEVVNGPIAIDKIELRILHVGSLWSHTLSDPPPQPSNGPFA